MNDYYETYDDPRAQADNLRVENARLYKKIANLEEQVKELQDFLGLTGLRLPERT